MTTTFTAPEVTSMMIAIGERKAGQPLFLTFSKAVMGGWMIGFGAMLVHFMHGYGGKLAIDAPAIINLLAALFFPIPLLMIMITGQELITMNLMVIPMAACKRSIRAWEVPLNWTLVTFGNLAGVLLYAALLGHYSELYTDTPAIVEYSISLAIKKTSLKWGVVVLRGIGCNFLVCAAVWLAVAAREMSSKIIAMYIPASLFVFLGFEHVAANMFFVPMAMLNGADITVGKYVAHSLIPSFIGNVIGGCVLGITMLVMYDPPELPSFLRRDSSRRSSLATVAANNNVATSVYEMDGALKPQ